MNILSPKAKENLLHEEGKIFCVMFLSVTLSSLVKKSQDTRRCAAVP